MKGFVAAAGIAGLAMAILAFAGMGGFGFRKVDGPPTVVDRGVSVSPEVRVTNSAGKVVYDEFGPDPTVPVAPAHRSQAIAQPSLKSPGPEVRVSARPTNKPKEVAKHGPRKVAAVAKVEPRVVRGAERAEKSQPRRVATREPAPLPPSRVYTPPSSEPRSSEPRVSDRREAVDWDQIERDRAWRRATIKRWQQEERERKKRQKDDERRAVQNEFDDNGRLKETEMEPVENVYKYDREKRRKRKG